MLKKVLLSTIAAIACLALPAAASALEPDAEPEGCATSLLGCYEKASKIDNFWYRWAAGIDCELNFTSCARQRILGR